MIYLIRLPGRSHTFSSAIVLMRILFIESGGT